MECLFNKSDSFDKNHKNNNVKENNKNNCEENDKGIYKKKVMKRAI